jgi:hypothetical protein
VYARITTTHTTRLETIIYLLTEAQSKSPHGSNPLATYSVTLMFEELVECGGDQPTPTYFTFSQNGKPLPSACFCELLTEEDRLLISDPLNAAIVLNGTVTGDDLCDWWNITTYLSALSPHISCSYKLVRDLRLVSYPRKNARGKAFTIATYRAVLVLYLQDPDELQSILDSFTRVASPNYLGPPGEPTFFSSRNSPSSLFRGINPLLLTVNSHQTTDIYLYAEIDNIPLDPHRDTLLQGDTSYLYITVPPEIGDVHDVASSIIESQNPDYIFIGVVPIYPTIFCNFLPDLPNRLRSSFDTRRFILVATKKQPIFNHLDHRGVSLPITAHRRHPVHQYDRSVFLLGSLAYAHLNNMIKDPLAVSTIREFDPFYQPHTSPSLALPKQVTAGRSYREATGQHTPPFRPPSSTQGSTTDDSLTTNTERHHLALLQGINRLTAAVEATTMTSTQLSARLSALETQTTHINDTRSKPSGGRLSKG